MEAPTYRPQVPLQIGLYSYPEHRSCFPASLRQRIARTDVAIILIREFERDKERNFSGEK
jgi:hypothetical protein